MTDKTARLFHDRTGRLRQLSIFPLTIIERDNEIAKPAEPVNGQDERRIRAAVDSPARLCW